MLKLDEKKPIAPESEPTNYGAIGASEAPAIQCAKDDADSTSIKALLAIKPIRILCTSGFSLSFTTMAFDVVFVLFCFSPIQDGGLGFSVGVTACYEGGTLTYGVVWLSRSKLGLHSPSRDYSPV
jgi:hypothetical protein